MLAVKFALLNQNFNCESYIIYILMINLDLDCICSKTLLVFNLKLDLLPLCLKFDEIPI